MEAQGDIRSRLLRVALQVLAERGYRGATTRLIAERAGVAELTLFRHFGSKLDLLRSALEAFEPPLEVPPPTEDLARDLKELLQRYSAFLEGQGGLILRILPEIIRHPELVRDGPPKGLRRVISEAVALFRAHQEAGRLWRGEAPEALALAFVGPLMARFLLGRAWGLVLPLEAEAYVQGFLEGRKGLQPDRLPP